MTIPRWEQIALAGPDAVTDEEAAGYAGIERSLNACSRSIAGWFGSDPMVVEYPGDKDYGEASSFAKDFRGLYRRFRSFQIQNAMASYAANMERVSSMHTLPLALIYWVARTTKNAAAAAAESGKPVLDSLSPETQHDPAVIAARSRIEEQESKLDAEAGATNTQKAAAFGAAHLKVVIKRQLEAIDDPEDHDLMRDYFTIGGVESILFSMVTSSYAAFETLASDLWIETVNSYPVPLAQNWLTEHGSKQNAKRLKIDFLDLAKFGFNTAHRMGHFLVEAEGVGFQRLETIKGNFCGAFGASALTCFSPEDPLYLAAKVRNLIAHRGGIVDAKFKSEVARFPEYADQRAGSHLSLTGGMVRHLVDACVECSLNLIKFVDDWTVDYESKAPKGRRLGDPG